MSKKNATVSVRINPEIKAEAEAILAKLGLPVSVVIDTLYRQIIMTGGLPYSMSVPSPRSLQDLSEDELAEIVLKGYEEGQKGKGIEAKEFFEKLAEGLK